MKVYLYIESDKIVLLSGIVASDMHITGQDLTIEYFNTPQPNTVMISLSTDQFVYLQDNGVLVTNQLLIN